MAATYKMMTTAEIETATPHELIAGFRPLAFAIANSQGDGTEDAQADALCGLVKAAKTYDSNKGAFKPWAEWYIKQNVVRGMRKRLDHISISDAKRKRMGAVRGAEETFARQGETATREQLAEEAGITVDELNELYTSPVARVTGEDFNIENVSLPVAKDFASQTNIDDVIDALEEHFKVEIPSDLVNEIAFWCKFDGGRSGMTKIVKKLRKLKTPRPKRQP